MPRLPTRSAPAAAGAPRSVRRTCLAVALLCAALALSLVPAAPAHADRPYEHPMPSGRWTHVRTDAYIHYACKEPRSGGYGPVYRVHTRTWSNGRVVGDIGVYAVTSRWRNSNVVDRVTNLGWLYGYNGNALWASAWYPDRLWIQGSYYGPPAPWDDGFPVARLVTCA